MALRSKRSQSRAEEVAQRKELQQDVFLREVDDALREDQMMEAFSRYWIPATAVIVLGLAALAGWLWYNNHQATLANQRGEAMVAVLDQVQNGNFKGADTALAPLAKDAGSGYAPAAKLMQGGLAMEQGKNDEAVKLFASVATDPSVPKAYRNLATVREVGAGFDKMKPEEVVAKLKPLAVKGNPWFGPAGELLGIAYMKQGKNDLAGPLFASMAKDKDLPETLRRRASQLAGVLGVDSIENPEAAVQDAAAAQQGE